MKTSLDSEIMYYFNKLQKLKEELKTITYKELGVDTSPPVHYRHIGRRLGFIHAAIDVYNKKHGTKIPQITALVVRTNNKSPGVGCKTQNPLEVFAFDYDPYVKEIESILNFMLIPSVKETLWNLEYNDIVNNIAELFYSVLNKG